MREGEREKERTEGMSAGRMKERRNEEAVRVAEVVVSRFVSAARLNIYDPLFGAVQPFSKKQEKRKRTLPRF